MKVEFGSVTYVVCAECDTRGILGVTAQEDCMEPDVIPCTCCENGTMERLDAVPANYVAVAVWMQDRAYGGPEEGGWYYDTFLRVDETTRCFTAKQAADAQAYADELAADWNERGYTVRAVPHGIKGARWPLLRPIYC